MRAYFISKTWPFQQHQDFPLLRFQYTGENGEWYCFARVFEGINQFVFLSTLEEKIPGAKRKDFAEFITRANFGLNIGNFELDFEDGEIRYKTSIDVSYDHLSNGLIEPIVEANLSVMDDYLPGILALLTDTISPKEAISLVLEKIKKDNEEYNFFAG